MKDIETEIKKIIAILRSGQPVHPDKLREWHAMLAGEYAFINSWFSQYEIEKYEKTREIRNEDGVNSDAQAERIFFSTDTGKEYLRCKRKLKSLEKMMSSIKILLEKSQREYIEINQTS